LRSEDSRRRLPVVTCPAGLAIETTGGHHASFLVEIPGSRLSARESPCSFLKFVACLGYYVKVRTVMDTGNEIKGKDIEDIPARRHSGMNPDDCSTPN